MLFDLPGWKLLHIMSCKGSSMIKGVCCDTTTTTTTTAQHVKIVLRGKGGEDSSIGISLVHI